MRSQKRKGRLFTGLAAMAILGLAAVAGSARADQVILNDGNTLTGTMESINAGVMKFKTPSLGEISIKLTDIKNYSTAAPQTIVLPNRQFATGTIQQGDSKQVVTAEGQTYKNEDIKEMNPPPVAWTGSVVVNGALNRGNTNTDSIGTAADATLRRDTPSNNDRFNINSAYNFARNGKGDEGTTVTDNLGAGVKYDDFINEKLYGYGNVGYFHDRIALLNYRLTPSLGIGYQWIEQKNLNLNTEVGAAYLYQDYQDAPIDQETSYRLAYHVDAALNGQVSVFNDAEFIAPFKFSDSNHYILNADAGIRANLTKSFFSEFKVVYVRNDHPVPGTLKDDLSYLLGVGWKF